MIVKKYILYVVIAGILTISIAYYLNQLEYEISNNVTVASEIGVGIIITIIVYGISRRSEVEIETKLNKVFDIVAEREKVRLEQKQHAERRLFNVFSDIDIDILQILSDADTYEKSEDPIQKKSYKKQIILSCQHIKNLAEENLDEPTIVSRDYFDFQTMGSFKTISSICKNEPIFINDGKIDVSFSHTLKKLIEPWIAKFSQELETTQEIPVPETPELKSDTSMMTMTTSSDRTVYPLDSTIHVQANVPFLIPGELMTFEVFNSKRKLLLSQQIDPTTHSHETYPDSKIFEVSFKMVGDDWKVGEVYIVRVTHGPSFSEDSFFIDQRIPAVQSDKSVYLWGSDMILTVIDPDADKDNDVAEFAGDREDSKIVILSSKGKLVNYRLRETGDSTGIFQGILGFIGVEDDGSTTGCDLDGKIITKTQGTEVDDGFIEVSKYEELKITYSNRSGIAALTAFVVKDTTAIQEAD